MPIDLTPDPAGPGNAIARKAQEGWNQGQL